MRRILIVDDDEINLSIACKALEKEYSITTALSGEKAVELVREVKFDLILLDILMPEMDGIETLKKIRKYDRAEKIPIIFLTSVEDRKIEEQCLKMGATEFISKPFSIPIMKLRISRILEIYELRNDLENQVISKNGQLEKITLQAIMAIANTIDAKDAYTKGHSIRVAAYSEEIARRLGWPEREITNLHYIALLHDIGKIGIPDSILGKPSQLTGEEFEVIKTHTTIGVEILKNMTLIRQVSDGARSHHERYDGTGYNDGLLGEEIPMVARIVGIADAYDAMTSDRAYRARLADDDVHRELINGRGTQFDPVLTDIMLEIIGQNIDTTQKIFFIEDEDALAVESNALLQKVLTEYAREIKDVSQRDALTGLWNRRYTEGQVNGYLWNELHNGALYLLDIDNFKQINDTFGHITGDEVLKNLSDAMTSLVSDTDIVCRMGGDEFVVFVKDINSRFMAEEIAKQIIRIFSQQTAHFAETINVSISIGITMAPDDGNNFSTLYANADKSLYYVKENGKNSYHFFREEISSTLFSPINTVGDLEALKGIIKERSNNTGAFRVEYEGFKRIYQFIERFTSRTHQPVQLLLLTLAETDGNLPNSDLLKSTFKILARAINLSLRRGDVATEYSSSQYLVLLIDASHEDGESVAERIKSNFTRLYSNVDVSVYYDIEGLDNDAIIKKLHQGDI